MMPRPDLKLPAKINGDRNYTRRHGNRGQAGCSGRGRRIRSARLAAPELQAAADKALVTLKILVGELLPEWRPPADYAAMVGRVTISN
jgi:hypothetical protein